MTETRKYESRYFNNPGPKNTGELLAFASTRFQELGLGKVVMATTTGRTVEEALEYFDPRKCLVVGVTHVTGYGEPGRQELSEEKRLELEEKGVKIVTAAHAFGSIGRAVRHKVGTFQVDEIMAYTLRMFSQGVKVAVEVSMMAADRGYVGTDEDIMAIGGTGRGADTAMVIKPANTHNALDLCVREIVAKPW